MGWVVPILQIAGAAYGASESRKAQKRAREQRLKQSGLVDKATGLSDEVAAQGRADRERSELYMNPIMRFYLRAAGGDRNTLTQLLQPELDRMGEGYDSARRSTATVAPRTGATAETSARMPMQRLSQIYQLFGKARAGAMGSLASLGTDYANRGAAGMNSAISGLTSAAGNQGNLQQLMLLNRQQSMAEGEAIGEGAGQAANWAAARWG